MEGNYLVDEVVPLHVGDGDLEDLPHAAGPGEGRVGVLDPQVDEAAEELEPAVAQHRPRQQPRLAQYLEAVADAQHQPALRRELPDRAHHRRVAGDGPRAQVVAVGEAPGEDDGVEVADFSRLVPNPFGGLAEDVAENMEGVVVAVAAGKNDHTELHRRGHTPSYHKPTRMQEGPPVSRDGR